MLPSKHDEELPSALCLYCNTRTPKYTCPRCNARTCSVACCKRHKVFRQCSGVRDPTAYVKRTKLMTATGINRDYNFLTSLEHEIMNPDFQVDDPEGSETNGPHTLRRTLEARRTIVRNAPWKGFTRAKENKTCLTGGRKRRQIHWTVEWILADCRNERRLDERVAERRAISESYFCYGNLPDNEPIKREGKNKERTKFYLVLQTPANIKRCARLNGGESLAENLKDREILEFPSIIVTTRPTGPQGWQIFEDRKIVELTEVDSESKTMGCKSDHTEDLEYIQRHVVDDSYR